MIFTILKYVGPKGDWFSLGNRTEPIDEFVSREGGNWYLEPSHPRYLVVSAHVVVPAENIEGWFVGMTDGVEGEFSPTSFEVQYIQCFDSIEDSSSQQILEYVSSKL